MDPITSDFSSSFMDPSSLNRIVHSPKMSEAAKVSIAAQEFESIFTKELIKDNVPSASVSASQKSNDHTTTFVPELLSHSLRNSSPFGLAKELTEGIINNSSAKINK